MRTRTQWYELHVDVGDEEIDQIPTISSDVLVRTRTGLKLVSQAVTAKGGHSLPDRLFVIHSSPMLLSDSAFAQIRHLRLCPTVEWHPVEVTWRRAIYAYRVGETMTSHDIWDYERSDYTVVHEDRPRGRTNIGRLRRGVIDRALLPSLDLFRAEFNRWIGSEAMKSAWEVAGASGMTFAELGIAG